MRPYSRYPFAGTAMVLVSFVVTLQLSAVVAPTASEMQSSSQIIDRTLKGDRLPDAPDAGGARLHDPKLPEGCVNVAEAPKSIYTTEIAGRCVV